MLWLSDNNQAGVIEALNSTSRYRDDLLNIDNPYSNIYPIELQFNKASSFDTEAPLFRLGPVLNEWHIYI